MGITPGPERIVEYARAVRAAGGEPVERCTDLAALDGLIFSGGADVDPRYYGQARHPLTEPVARERDDFEIALAVAAFQRRTPVLAICRGLQIVNVALGGSLHQHVPDVVADDIPHVLPDDDPQRRGLIDSHVVATRADSRLAGIAGATLVTGSRHHQAVDRSGAGLTVVARTPDGIVEALESSDATRFLLGVQWHPESTLDDDDGVSLAIFRALIGWIETAK